MHSKYYFVVALLTALFLNTGSLVEAQTEATHSADAGQGSASSSAPVLRGHVADPTGALIAGARISVVDSSGTAVAHATADATGSYEIHGLRPGTYTVQAAFEGFAPFVSPAVTLVADQSKRVDISLAVQSEKEDVTVSDETEGVGLDASNNASAMVIKGADLDALSDDPDELQNQLNALAGPSAGPNGGQIYIDGFSGGTLPPKSSILEIRINQSPFSAEFDRVGFGRIEIITKPGTDTFHGRGFMQGNDKAFNTGNPFTKSIPDYHTIQYNANVSGSYKKKISYFVSFDGGDNQDASVYSAAVPVYNSTTGLYYIPYDSNGNIIPQTGSLLTPNKRYGFSPRLDFQLGSKNTITTRFMYNHNSSTGSIGSTSLPSLSSNSSSTSYMLQIGDTIILSNRLVNEARLQLRRSISSSTPASNAPMISVADYFSGGGSSSQYSSGHTDHIELQDLFTLSAGAHAVKFGVWLRDNRLAQASDSNFNGTFNFISLTDYVNTLNGKPSAATLTYTTGKTKFKSNVFDAAGYIQDDWKLNQFLTLSGGLRFESQNHINDHADFAPRVALAYALDGHKTHKSSTILRVGYGFFYDRYSVSSLMSLARNNGSADSQTQTVITNPTCYSATSLSGLDLSTCGSGTNIAKATSELWPNYHSPYMEQLSASIDRQFGKRSTASLTYMHTYGVHQSATRNANAYLPGTYVFGSTTLTGIRPDSSKGIVNETYPEAVFKENQLTLSLNVRLKNNLSVTGYYSAAFSNGNTGAASNSWDLKQNYGRSSFTPRNNLMLMGNLTAPFKISLSPFMMASSGSYYNITTSTDLTGDNYYNDRPAYATASSCSTGNPRYVNTSFGCMDVTPDPGSTLIPINMGKGPASFSFNVRASRSFAIGPKSKQTPGGMMGGMMGGGFRGGGMPMGGPMGGMFGSRSRYSLNFNVQVQNLFNNVNYGTPSGSIVPTLDTTTGLYGPGDRFGKSMSLGGMGGGMGGGGGSSSAVRRITFQMSFSF